MITYTPAPWAVGKAIAGEPAVVKRDGDDVTILAIVKVNGDGDTDANALLMAAAPDGLDFAEEFVDWAENHAGSFAYFLHVVANAELDQDEGWKGLVAMAAAFIAKARAQAVSQ